MPIARNVPLTRRGPARALSRIAVLAIALAAGTSAFAADQPPGPPGPPPAFKPDMQPTDIGKLIDPDRLELKGQVVEIYGDKFILQDQSGRMLVEAGGGPGMMDGSPVQKDETVTVQGSFAHGSFHARAIQHADGRIDAMRGHPPMSRDGGPHEGGPRGEGHPGWHGGCDRAPPPPPPGPVPPRSGAPDDGSLTPPAPMAPPTPPTPPAPPPPAPPTPPDATLPPPMPITPSPAPETTPPAPDATPPAPPPPPPGPGNEPDATPPAPDATPPTPPAPPPGTTQPPAPEKTSDASDASSSSPSNPSSPAPNMPTSPVDPGLTPAPGATTSPDQPGGPDDAVPTEASPGIPMEKGGATPTDPRQKPPADPTGPTPLKPTPHDRPGMDL